MLTHFLSDESTENLQQTPLSFLGNFFGDNALVCGIADGLVDPTTKVHT